MLRCGLSLCANSKERYLVILHLLWTESVDSILLHEIKQPKAFTETGFPFEVSLKEEVTFFGKYIFFSIVLFKTLTTPQCHV